MIGLPKETFAEVEGIVDLGFRARDIGRQHYGVTGASRCTSPPPTSFPSRTRPSSGRAWPIRSSSRSSTSTCAARCAAGSSGSPCTTPAPPPSRQRSAVAMASRRRDRDRVAQRRALRRLDRAPRRGVPGAARSLRTAATSSARPSAAAIPSRRCRWDHVKSGVTREFLLDEWWQAEREAVTGDCRWDGCSDCGACMGPVRNRLVQV